MHRKKSGWEIMYTCKETVRMLSTDEKLTFKQKIELRAHLFMCKHCSSFSKQLNAIKNKFKSNFGELTKVEPEQVKNLEEKVIARIAGDKSRK